MAHAHRGSRLIGIVAAIYGLILLYSIGAKVMSSHKVHNLTEHMKPVCVGRFLIDLPSEMDYSYGHTFITGFWLAAIPESDEEFLKRVAAREAEINAAPNEAGKKNMEQVEAVSVHGLTGKIFNFGRTSVEGVKKGKPVYYVNVAQEGYVHASNTTFTFKIDAIDPDQTNILSQIIEKLRVVAPDEIPTAPGFCFGRGMLVDPVPVEWTEGVVMFAGFRAHPDLAIAFHTRAGLGKDPYDPGLLARDARVDDERPSWTKPLFKKLRRGRRSINGIDGEEVLERTTEIHFTNVYTGDWEVTGTRDNAFLPDMHLEMSTGHPVHAGARPVPTFLGGDDAVVQLWDKVSSSIRVRPTKPTPTAGTGAGTARPSPKLGDSVSAGDICPATGWWQCADGGKDIGVLGGQRQRLHKGQRMPQALLLPPRTAWEEVRGVQASYESSQPTAWTLTDRRSKARVTPAIPLEPAISRSGAATFQRANTSMPPAVVGSFASTGEACPTSGWWRCQDSDALDATRWFAQGALLPAATFRVAQRKAFFGSPDATVFQRRSVWQLVRQAPEPGDDA